jgi:hypothetical protein
MGARSPQPPPQKGPQATFGQAPVEIRRRLAARDSLDTAGLLEGQTFCASAPRGFVNAPRGSMFARRRRRWPTAGSPLSYHGMSTPQWRAIRSNGDSANWSELNCCQRSRASRCATWSFGPRRPHTGPVSQFFRRRFAMWHVEWRVRRDSDGGTDRDGLRSACIPGLDRAVVALQLPLHAELFPVCAAGVGAARSVERGVPGGPSNSPVSSFPSRWVRPRPRLVLNDE